MHEKWTQILEQITESTQIKIYRHVSPDPDAYGSQYALATVVRNTFPHIKIACEGEKVERLNYLYNHFTNDVLDNEQPILHIVVDTANTERIDGMESITDKHIIKIDHHPNVDPYGYLQFVDDTTPATCAMLLDFFLQAEKIGALILSDVALECLYAGIIADTGNFSYGVGLNKTFFTNIGELFERINTKQILERFYAKTQEEIKFKGYYANNIQEFCEGFYHVSFTSADVKEYGVTIDFATSLVNVMSEVAGAKIWASFCAVPEDGEIRCSLRSRFLRISDIAAKFGGGGHPQAAGIRVKTWDEVALIQEEIKELLARNDE